MILIVSLCKEKMHELEFVRPIEKIVSSTGNEVVVCGYDKIKNSDLKNASGVILSGTSLDDFEYLENAKNFLWLKNFKKPVLGICAGMQAIGLVFSGRLVDDKYIGLSEINFKETFLGLNGKNKVYFLHNKSIMLPEGFAQFDNGNFPMAFKHKTKKIYGVLFHPEVYNHELLKEFVKTSQKT